MINEFQLPFPGELSALTAALMWAIASVLYADIGRHVPAVLLNLVKGTIASLLMLLTLTAGTLLHAPELALASLQELPAAAFWMLAASGIMGIAIGDTAYFACINRIGPQKGLMLESTSPVLAAVMAVLLYGEWMPLQSWIGIVLTSGGVILVVGFATGAPGYRNSFSGILLGVLAAFCQAGGIVLSRMAVDGEGVAPLAAGLIRLGSALLVLTVVLFLRRQPALRIMARPLHPQLAGEERRQLYTKLAGAVFLGTYIAIWLQQVAVKYTQAGTAQALLATCPLFGMLIAWRKGYRQNFGVWLGVALSLGGVILFFH